jgi:sulfotransferase family protein
LPIPTQVLRLADAVAGACGALHRPFSIDGLIRTARRRARSEDFGDVDITEPLRRLLDACTTEARLSLVGRLATQWDVVRFLSNLLRLRAAESARPEILDEPIAQPIFITGLPRSGTTFLHRMMLEDPANRAPLVYETIYPYAPASGRRDRRVAQVASQLHTFEALAPEFHGLHPLESTSPQECSEITAHVFRSLRFDSNYRIPSYRAWLDSDPRSHLPAYRFHRRFLQHLQHQDAVVAPPGTTPRARPRWVLKCPDHLFALEAIRAVYPDANLVFVHRDPVKVLLSVTRLTEVLRRPFTRRLDPKEIGQAESLRWQEGTRRMMAVGDEAGLPEPVCHVHYLDLVSDPVATLEQVYGHFGLALPSAAIRGIERLVAAQPNGGYAAHAYHFEDHGLDAEMERRKFRDYMLRFGVVPEVRGTKAPLPAKGKGEPRGSTGRAQLAG